MAERKKPGWSSKELRTSITQYDGSGYNQDAEPFAQFLHAVAKFLRKRLLRDAEALKSAHSIFLMSSIPRGHTPSRREPLLTAARHDPAGWIWFGRERFNSAVAVPLPACGDAELVDHIVDELGVGGTPAIFFDSDDEVVRIYPQGMENPEACWCQPLSSAEVTLEFIHDLLDRLHANLLVTPSASDSPNALWEDRVKAYPIKEAERGIQQILNIAFVSNTSFEFLKVEQEHKGVMGRCDFILKEQDPFDNTTWTNHAILELKVVKSFTHTGSSVADSANKQAVSDGLDQARDYRSSHSCRLAALCCYDMRKPPDHEQAIEHELERAQSESVALWSWPIHNITKSARAANTALIAAKKGGKTG